MRVLIFNLLFKGKNRSVSSQKKALAFGGLKELFLGRRRPLIVAIDPIGRLTARRCREKTPQIDPKSRFLPEIAWNSRSGTPVCAKNIVFFFVFQ